jgi:hypothetical protein
MAKTCCGDFVCVPVRVGNRFGWFLHKGGVLRQMREGFAWVRYSSLVARCSLFVSSFQLPVVSRLALWEKSLALDGGKGVKS